MKEKSLITTAKELQEILELKPELDVSLDPKELTIQVKEAATLLEADDSITEETTQALRELFPDSSGLNKKVIEVFAVLEILGKEGQEDEKPGEPKDVKEDDLFTEVDNAERMKDLKDIAKSNDEFKTIRGELSKYKSTESLRTAMLDVLDGSEPEKTEPETAPKKDEVKPVEKKKVDKFEKESSIISRSDAVAQAIRKLCKRGATIQEIMSKSDEIYVQAGGKSNPTATNVNRYALHALVEFDVLAVNDNGKYKFAK